jgi:hypothetical protein
VEAIFSCGGANFGECGNFFSLIAALLISTKTSTGPPHGPSCALCTPFAHWGWHRKFLMPPALLLRMYRPLESLRLPPQFIHVIGVGHAISRFLMRFFTTSRPAIN